MGKFLESCMCMCPFIVLKLSDLLSWTICMELHLDRVQEGAVYYPEVATFRMPLVLPEVACLG